MPNLLQSLLFHLMRFVNFACPETHRLMDKKKPTEVGFLLRSGMASMRLARGETRNHLFGRGRLSAHSSIMSAQSCNIAARCSRYSALL